ncbi:hypothetical protein E2320_012555, partial [Naja naja]
VIELPVTERHIEREHLIQLKKKNFDLAVLFLPLAASRFL